MHLCCRLHSQKYTHTKKKKILKVPFGFSWDPEFSHCVRVKDAWVWSVEIYWVVTLFARFRGWSTLNPLKTVRWYASNCTQKGWESELITHIKLAWCKAEKKMLVKLARMKKYTRKYRTVNNCGWKSSNTILYFLLYCSIFWEIKWYMNYEGVAFKDKPLKIEEKECHRCIVHVFRKSKFFRARNSK